MRGKAVTTFCSGLLVFFFVCLIGGVGAQVESFYRGKTITIVVGYNPGDATTSGRARNQSQWPSSMAMLLPVSTPPNAIAFSTGLLEQKDFRIVGSIIGVLGPPLIIAWVLLIS